MTHKAWCSIKEVSYYFLRSSIKFQGHTGWKIDDLDQIWARLLGRSQLSNPSDLPCYHPYDFLPVRPSEAPVGILHWCCSRGHIRLRGRTAWHGCILMVWIIRRAPWVPVRCQYGHRTGHARESSILFISYGARAWPARVPYGALTDT